MYIKKGANCLGPNELKPFRSVHALYLRFVVPRNEARFGGKELQQPVSVALVQPLVCLMGFAEERSIPSPSRSPVSRRRWRPWLHSAVGTPSVPRTPGRITRENMQTLRREKEVVVTASLLCLRAFTN